MFPASEQRSLPYSTSVYSGFGRYINVHIANVAPRKLIYKHRAVTAITARKLSLHDFSFYLKLFSGINSVAVRANRVRT
jgi:hypothetical protein